MARPPEKTRAVQELLLQQLVDHRWRPGEKLPHRKDLVAMTGANWVTVQRAFDRLKADGQVRAVSGQGTYVTAQPPCLSTFGLVTARRTRTESHLRRAAIAAAAADLAASASIRFQWYRDLYTAPDGLFDEELLAQLEEDLASRRLAGLIFCSNPWPIGNAPLLQQAAVPLGALMSERQQRYPRVQALAPGIALPILELGLDRLAAEGCRRIALLATAKSFNPQMQSTFAAAVEQRGMTTRRWWIQHPQHEHADWVANCVELLLRSTEAPDGLLITDDHLSAPAVRGIAAAGRTVPDDLVVVAGANFPRTESVPLPFIHIGHDFHEIMAQAVRRLRGLSAPAAPTLQIQRYDDAMMPIGSLEHEKTQ